MARYSLYRPLKSFRGNVCSDASKDTAKAVESFDAKVIILNHPGKIRNGYTPILDIHTAHVPCRFAKIQSKIDRITGKVTELNPECLKTGDSAIITMEPLKEICVETFKMIP